MATHNTIITSVKILLISTSILFFGIILSPLVTSVSSNLPAIWTVIKSYLRPPYLYVIINGIIITIVASSRLHRHTHHQSQPEIETRAPPVHKDVSMTYQSDDVISVKDVGVVEVKVEEEVEEEEEEEEEVKEMMTIIDQVEEFKWTPSPLLPKPLMRQEAVAELLSGRPPAVSRFGHHRRATKGSPTEGRKALRRVAKPKKQDTLESTWKAITEGRHIPLTRHLKKSDTWENNDRQINLLDSSPPLDHVKKSQTFTDRANDTSPHVVPSTTKLKKEPSLGQEELNRRVEAFINKFNEDMRLQRQQSVQQFMEMINRAA